jgi:hypothetical protein
MSEHKIRLMINPLGYDKILGCSCGWKIPPGTTDPDDAIAMHIATRGVLDQPTPPTPGLYRHYKGGTYTVLGLATTEATGIPVVVYTNVTTGQWWTRPVEDFIAMVEHEGEQVPRFRRLG